MPQDLADQVNRSALTSNWRLIEPSLTVGPVPRLITVGLCLIALACTIFVAGCSKGAGGNGLHVKSPATGEKDLAVKSAYAFAVTKSFTDANGKVTTAPSYRVYAANYDLDAANFAMTLDKPLTSDEHLRVVFSLVGEQGGIEKTPLKAGTYSAKADKFMKVEDVGIVSRKGGADSKVWLDRSTLTGNVKVNSVSGGTMSCDVDLSAGETSIHCQDPDQEERGKRELANSKTLD
jgi:hypothetical protein